MPGKKPDPAEAPLRLNRFLARAGLGSRRGVETLIEAGRVQVDGETVLDLGRRVDHRRQRIEVDGRPVALPETWRVLMFHKPRGMVCSLVAQDSRPCLAGAREAAGLPLSMIPVGRLDADTSGLLLWTDDGDLAQTLCRPASEVWKTYELRLDAPLDPAVKPLLRDGRIELDGRPCLPAELKSTGGNGRDWTLRIREGRNRQVRRMFEAIGRRIRDLHRSGYGPLGLGKLAPGDFRKLSKREIAGLRAAARRSAEEA